MNKNAAAMIAITASMVGCGGGEAEDVQQEQETKLAPPTVVVVEDAVPNKALDEESK